MGAWNTKPFGNDTACDWLYQLVSATDFTVLESAINRVLRSETPEDSDACEKAIAAAAVVAASRRNPIRGLPSEAKQWLKEHGLVASNSLVGTAVRAVGLIKERSELRELWWESPSFEKWQKQMESLLLDLRDLEKMPLPMRRPTPLSGRLSLPKLVEKVNPNEESPLRDKLRKKLEGIVDVNAPLNGTYFQTPLNLVAARGLIPEAKRLIERGALVNPELKDPLNGRTPLEEACARGHAEMAEVLLGFGAEIYFPRTFNVFLAKGKFGEKVFKLPRALYRAVESGDVATVKVLSRYGADLTDENSIREIRSCHAVHYETLLHGAVTSGNVQMLDHLVKHGLEVDAKDSCGDTPLKRAVLKRRLNLVHRFLELGADPNVEESEGALFDLIQDDDPAIALILRKWGAKSKGEK
jgi:ankyrin repeat protein